MPQRIGCGKGDLDMSRDSTRDTIRYLGGILDTEAVVPTHIRNTATTLPYRFGEDVGRLRIPVSAGRPIHT